jgi:hypothetical protein
MARGACTCEGIVAGNRHQAGKKRVTGVTRSAGKLRERMLAGWARRELTATHDQGAKYQQPLVVFR